MDYVQLKYQHDASLMLNPSQISRKNIVRLYLSITKPGIIFGNLITTIAGFFVALNGQAVPFVLFFWVLFSTSCVIAAAAVMNNCIDRDIDQLMERTKNRAVSTGEITLAHAWFFAAILLIVGFFTLWLKVNLLSVLFAVLGVVVYVLFYSLFLKRRSQYTTIVGSFSGAMPPLIGYCAVNNRIDLTAILLFITLVFWQIPHSYAISIYRIKDYQNACIPIYPIIKGLTKTIRQMACFIMLFLISSSLLILNNRLSYFILIVNFILTICWLYLVFSKKEQTEEYWGKSMFLLSIVVITNFSLLLILSSIVK